MIRIQSIGYKEEGKPYQMPNERIFQRELDSLPPGKYQHTVEKYRRKATPKQFGYLFGCVYPLSMIAGNNAGYEFKDIDDVDLFWRTLFANKPIFNRETGEAMIIPMSKADFLTIDEMAYTDAIRNYVSEYWNSNIPDPDPRYKFHKKTENDFVI